jgi:hypothetical protein
MSIARIFHAGSAKCNECQVAREYKGIQDPGKNAQPSLLPLGSERRLEGGEDNIIAGSLRLLGIPRRHPALFPAAGGGWLHDAAPPRRGHYETFTQARMVNTLEDHPTYPE